MGDDDIAARHAASVELFNRFRLAHELRMPVAELDERVSRREQVVWLAYLGHIRQNAPKD